MYSLQLVENFLRNSCLNYFFCDTYQIDSTAKIHFFNHMVHRYSYIPLTENAYGTFLRNEIKKIEMSFNSRSILVILMKYS